MTESSLGFTESILHGNTSEENSESTLEKLEEKCQSEWRESISVTSPFLIQEPRRTIRTVRTSSVVVSPPATRCVHKSSGVLSRKAKGAQRSPESADMISGAQAPKPPQDRQQQ